MNKIIKCAIDYYKGIYEMFRVLLKENWTKL